MESSINVAVKWPEALQHGGVSTFKLHTRQSVHVNSIPNPPSAKRLPQYSSFPVVKLTLWPEPSSCVRWFLSARCAASPNVLPLPCWETPSRRCSRSPSPGGAPHLSTSTGNRRMNRLLKEFTCVAPRMFWTEVPHLPPGRWAAWRWQLSSVLPAGWGLDGLISPADTGLRS